VNAFWRALSKNRLALIGGAVVLVLAIMAVAAPLMSPHDPHKPDIRRILDPPSARHWLGTDQIGRDVLSRIPAHSITRLNELLPHNWKPSTSPSPSQA